jgi:hypothetical protein
MSGDWVNRIGIILNFCAGFLLAPELIGIQRLQRFEKFLEESVPRFRNFVEGLPRRIQNLLELGLPWLVFNSIGSLAIWWVFVVTGPVSGRIAAISVAVPLVAFCVSGLILRLIRRPRVLERSELWEWMDLINGLSFALLMLELSALLIPLMILGTVCWVLVRVSAGLLSWVLGIVLVRLTGSDRLRGVVVILGIAVFIVGNALQLWATWLSDS